MRRKVIAGNWKMNMLPNEAIEFITELQKMKLLYVHLLLTYSIL